MPSHRYYLRLLLQQVTDYTSYEDLKNRRRSIVQFISGLINGVSEINDVVESTCLSLLESKLISVAGMTLKDFNLPNYDQRLLQPVENLNVNRVNGEPRVRGTSSAEN
ncbi:hypothetical protein Pcinc_016960 [Petrolisthes cinctipes]|uniref:Uncharacterized protein n=1 Tax=Petrolisthes cinctipes TaxID=88211 RepID=A0AAE1KL84_PETCI|nr:hypothetical protein Pcinc_016960 [Petrolisthes cinctipes]